MIYVYVYNYVKMYKNFVNNKNGYVVKWRYI